MVGQTNHVPMLSTTATIIILTVTNFQSTSSFICLTYNLKENIIEFECEVYAKYTVAFRDQNGNELGNCAPPFHKPNCSGMVANVHIHQNLQKNRTMLTMSAKISDQINGEWKCLHGTNIDKAVVNITVFSVLSEEKHCLITFVGVSTCSFLVILTFVNVLARCFAKEATFSRIKKCRCFTWYLRKEKGNESVADFVMVFIFIAIPVIFDWIIKCSPYHLELLMIFYGFLCALLRWILVIGRRGLEINPVPTRS